MLDLIEGRKIFADHLQGNYYNAKSLDAALMAALEWAYRRGLEDGNTETTEKPIFMAQKELP